MPIARDDSRFNAAHALAVCVAVVLIAGCGRSAGDGAVRETDGVAAEHRGPPRRILFGLAASEVPDTSAAAIAFTLDAPGRVSLAVFSEDGAVQHRSLLVGERLAAGSHTVAWDGLDRDGRPLAPGAYTWRLVTGPGIRATFLNALGANPPGGPWAKWVGNHTGPNTVAAGPAGVCVGSPNAEGPLNMILLTSDFKTTRWSWGPSSSLGPRVLRMSGAVLISLAADARVSVFDAGTGAGVASVDVLWEGDERPGYNGGRELHLGALGDRFVVSYRHHDAVRWFDRATGKIVREVQVAKPSRVAMRADGSLLVLGEKGVVLVNADDTQSVVIDAAQLVNPAALAWDESDNTFLVANGAPDNRIVRFSADGNRMQTYGIEGGRRPGPYFPDRFAEVADLAADNGRFYVVEGGEVGGGLRRVAHVAGDGEILDERFGGAEFFSAASAVPGNPREVYYSSCPRLIGRYELDPETGKNRLTHLLENRNWGFPGFTTFPHYRPVARNGRVYLVLQGRFILRPDLETGQLLPIALADHRPWHGWRTVPERLVKAAAHHGIDPQSSAANAYTWSDTNGNGQVDPEEFRFHHTAPRPGYAFLDDNFNVIFGYYYVGHHTYDTVNSLWMGFDFKRSLYATLPNDAPDGETPVWDWSRIALSQVKIHEDPLGLWQRSSGIPFKFADGRVNLLTDGSGGGHVDLHPHPWPTAQTTGMRILSAVGERFAYSVGKHASEGPPRDTQFGYPSHILGTVNDDILIVCDRAYYTTAWTADGLFVGMLHEQPHFGPRPESDRVGLAGDDWAAAGSIADLGNGEALWFAPSGDRAMIFRVTGFGDLQRQAGTVELRTEPSAAPLDGVGLKAGYFASTDLGGDPVVSRTDPRLWFYDTSVQGLIVAAWAANGPCEGIAAGKPFSARWTGSFIAPYSEPFWFRIYNARHGHPHAPDQQAWRDGKSFVRVWLNGQVILDKWHDSPRPNPWQTPPQTPPLMLQAGARYDLKVEYAYPGGADAQFSLVWCSYTLEWMRVPTAYLYPDPAPARPRVSVEAVQPVAREEGGQPGVVRFSLEAPHARDIEIRYRIGGTASAEDYLLEHDRVVIPAGETTAELVLRPVDDDQVEANETAVVILTPSPEYAGDGTDGAAAVTIVDNDNILVDDDLVVYYTFDNASLAGDAFGFSAIRNDAGAAAALSVQSYLHALPAFVPGLPGHGDGLTFPPGRTSVQSGGGLRLADFTVAFWFKAPKGAGTIGICQSGLVEFFLQDGAMVANYGGWYSRQPAGANLDDGQWHHVAFIWNQADRQQQLHVDGVRVSTNPGPEGGGHSGVTRLGHATGGAFVGGVIDDYRIYRRRLTADEVEAFFTAHP